MILSRFFNITLYIGILFAMFSCSGGSRRFPVGDTSAEKDSSMQITFAQGFTLQKTENVTLLTVLNPWQGAQNKIFRYALVSGENPVSDSLSAYTVIRTPVEKVVCLSTTHVAMLSAIGKASSIKAMSGTAFIHDSAVRKRIDCGEIVDVGYGAALDIETIVALKPDVIFAYGIGQETMSYLSKLADLGLTVVLNAEYLERTALGKAEWMKFMAAFYHCEEQANALFGRIRQEYDSLKLLPLRTTNRPAVMCDLPWRGSWYIPGGQTSTASMILDAGGNYLWKDNPSHESFPVTIEAAINKGVTADIWINTGAARSLAEIKATDERLSLAKPWQTGQVFSNFARATENGGNDFFESGIVRPHVVLKDLIRIFHPDLLPNHSLYYYLQLK
ncbi:MAG: ABC transporter substrate-binding protein [Bacteroidales bacterium]|jgi:iron complex transport system substrate-binding protein|nr:ABC transporter substrate-binding protein [Bacteroidales bacterium]